MEGYFTWPHLFGLVTSLVILVVIAVVCARRNRSSQTYFLAGRAVPGWVVGLSIMATDTSSMIFTADPGFAFAENWRMLPAYLTYPFAMVIALFLFMPFFRRARINSAYEYLERRFGLWARLYAAVVFLLFRCFKMGIVLYAVCLPVHAITGLPLSILIVGIGVLVAFYTIAGGLEAVLWTDVFQAAALALGGIVCLPIMIFEVPGGLSELLQVAQSHDKFSLGNTSFTLSEKTFWAVAFTSFFFYLQQYSTDQTMIQRYLAPKTDREARRAIIVGTLTTFPVWMYFLFIGTALYAYYQIVPDPAIDKMVPEQVLPYFVLTRVPAFIAGFVIAGLFAAAMSTLDSSVNASAATVTFDFYRRLWVTDRDERHYLGVGRVLSLVFAAVMIGVALAIHFARTQTLADLHLMVISMLAGGILGLFLLGFLTRSVDSTAAMVATACTALGVGVWMFLGSAVGRHLFPALAESVPNLFWVNVISTLFLFGLGYVLTAALRRRCTKNLDDLTVWTVRHSDRH